MSQLGQSGQSKLNKKSNNRLIIQSLKKEYTSMLAEYKDLIAKNTNSQKSFIQRTSSSNPYLSSIISLPTGEEFYVTAGGIARYISSDEIRELLILNSSITSLPTVVDVAFRPEYLKSGTSIPTTPPLISGIPVTKHETIGNEGNIVMVNSILNPNKIPSPSYKSCKNSAGSSYFIGNAPSLDTPNEYNGEFSFKSCMDAAITNGASFFGFGNVDPKTQLGYCSAANTLDELTNNGDGTLTNTISLWSSQTTGNDNFATLTTAGSFSVLNKDNVSIFSTPITSQFPSNYIGCYNDDDKNRRLQNNFGTGYTYNKCRDEISKTSYLFFGLQNKQPDNTGECWAGDDLNYITGLGKANNCSTNEGISIGGGWSNAVYSTPSTTTSSNDVCPSDYPYDAHDGKICYNDKKYADQQSGPCDSWCTNDTTFGSGCGDPNLKLCSTNASPDQTSSVNASFFLILTNSGNIEVYRGSGPLDKQELIWESKTSKQQRDVNPKYSAINGKTGTNWMPVGTVLNPGEFIGSTNGDTYLMMQNDGNVVLYTSVIESNCKSLSNGIFGGSIGASAIYSVDLSTMGPNAISSDNINSLNKLGYVSHGGKLHEFPNNKLSLDDNFIKRENYNITATTKTSSKLETIQDTTPELCQSACTSNDVCRAAVFNKTTNHCSIHDAYDFDSELSPNPAINSYIRTRKPTITPPGVSNNIVHVDSVEYNNYRHGDDITTSSSFGLSLPINAPHKERIKQLSGELKLISNKIIQLTGQFSQNEQKTSLQMDNNTKKIDTYVNEYKQIHKQVLKTSKETNNGLNNINKEYTITTVYEQYQYVFWTILVLILIVVIMKLS